MLPRFFGGVSRPSRKACRVDAPHTARGGVLDQREDVVFVTVHAAGRQQAEHVQRGARFRRVDRAVEHRIAPRTRRFRSQALIRVRS